MKKAIYISIIISIASFGAVKIPDTGQSQCYSASTAIPCPKKEDAFYGQDAQYSSFQPSYKDNGDGTVSDLVTGLMWSKEVTDTKYSLDEANAKSKSIKIGGYDDWRIPTVKELYSLIDFRGYTGFSGNEEKSTAPANAIPYINTDFFDFKYGASDERYIDAQWVTITKYVSLTMEHDLTLFGVNFADGRIKGYGYKRKGSDHDRKKFYVKYVRGTTAYGKNDFVDNNNGTLKDKSTNLLWTKQDSQKGMNWNDALKYCQNLQTANIIDWRLPDAKELQYIIDYSRSPETTNSPAIDPKFELSAITNEARNKDWGYYWTSTTHLEGPKPGNNAAYVSFGRALGKMNGKVIDVHGAGAQRSDPKVGTSKFHGPQGDAIRVNNYVLCISGGSTQVNAKSDDINSYPNVLHVEKNNGQGYSKKETFNKLKNNNIQKKQNKRGFVARLDKNGDGKVSRNEFDGPSQAFSRLDKNNDGFLSDDESPKGPPHKRK